MSDGDVDEGAEAEATDGGNAGASQNCCSEHREGTLKQKKSLSGLVPAPTPGRALTPFLRASRVSFTLSKFLFYAVPRSFHCLSLIQSPMVRDMSLSDAIVVG